MIPDILNWGSLVIVTYINSISLILSHSLPGIITLFTCIFYFCDLIWMCVCVCACVGACVCACVCVCVCVCNTSVCLCAEICKHFSMCTDMQLNTNYHYNGHAAC